MTRSVKSVIYVKTGIDKRVNSGQTDGGSPLEFGRGKRCVGIDEPDKYQHHSNDHINTAAISDAVRTSLGPRGMDKMVKRSLKL